LRTGRSLPGDESNKKQRNFKLFLKKIEKLPDNARKNNVSAERSLRIRSRARTTSKPEVPNFAEFENASVFGSSLELQMQIQKRTYPDLDYPVILDKIEEALRSVNSFKTEFGFQKQGNIAEERRLKEEIDTSILKDKNYKMVVKDPYVPAHLIRVWLNHLPEPLIPMNLQFDCLERLESARRCVSLIQRKLPYFNLKVVQFLIKLFQRFTEVQNLEKTKMGVNNISILFAPFFLRFNEGSDSDVMAENEMMAQKFLRNLIGAMKFGDYKKHVEAPPPVPPAF